MTSRLITSLRLPPVKAVVALAIASVLALVGVIFGSARPDQAIILAIGLSWASMVDVDRLILPDAITVGLLVVGLSLAALTGEAAFASRIIGAGLGYGAMMLIAIGFRRIRRRDGLGQGDAKLLCAAGAWLGWAALPFVVVLGATAALACSLVAIASRRHSLQSPIAFGPFLAAGFWVIWLVMPLPPL